MKRKDLIARCWTIVRVIEKDYYPEYDGFGQMDIKRVRKRITEMLKLLDVNELHSEEIALKHELEEIRNKMRTIMILLM